MKTSLVRKGNLQREKPNKMGFDEFLSKKENLTTLFFPTDLT